MLGTFVKAYLPKGKNGKPNPKKLAIGMGVAKQSAGNLDFSRKSSETIRGTGLKPEDIVQCSERIIFVRAGPAVAVIRRGQALSGFIGRKVCVGSLKSRVSNAQA